MEDYQRQNSPKSAKVALHGKNCGVVRQRESLRSAASQFLGGLNNVLFFNQHISRYHASQYLSCSDMAKHTV